MKNRMKLLSGILLSIAACAFALVKPTFAEECSGGVATTILGNGGCYTGGIWGILGLAIDILTIGIGAAAVVGIVISGIQYMTATGDPAKVTKAKNRIFQILIGIVVLGVFYGLMRWLVPGWD